MAASRRHGRDAAPVSLTAEAGSSFSCGEKTRHRRQAPTVVPGKLKHARPAVCGTVLVLYGGLSVRGFQHAAALWAGRRESTTAAIFDDFKWLMAIYSAEVVAAVAFGVSTMYRWSRRHFLEHHLPLVVVTILYTWQDARTQGRAAAQHCEWMALVLLISFNEMTAALLVIWPNPLFDRVRVVPNILIQLCLLATETRSWWRATTLQLVRRDPDMWIPTLLSQFLLAAAAIHISYFSQLSRLFSKIWLDKD